MRNVRNVRVLDWDFDMVFEVLIEEVNGRIWSEKKPHKTGFLFKNDGQISLFLIRFPLCLQAGYPKGSNTPEWQIEPFCFPVLFRGFFVQIRFARGFQPPFSGAVRCLP